ncbi:ATP-binding protein [Nonomuraea ferruginea]
MVRAALSEVEGYERVQVKVHRATSVLGSVANDLVHLVAELVENALQFSPSNSQVTVSSSLIEGGGALLSVTDSGISMTEEELAEANRRLAEPPVVDVSVSRRMGLFVVGRLALRHGIRVQLRRGEGIGLIAMVLIPPALIQDATRQPLPQRPAFGGGSTSVPHRPQVPAQNGYRSHGSLDSYDSGAGRPALGPFGADTDAPRHSYDSGTFPSYPSAPPASRGSRPARTRPSSRPPRSGPDPSPRSRARSCRARQPGRSDFPNPDVPSPEGPPTARHAANDVRRPEPPPSTDVSPIEAEREEYLPIFAAVESAWFRSAAGGAGAGGRRE